MATTIEAADGATAVDEPATRTGHPGLTLAITGAALFMVVLDNLVEVVRTTGAIGVVGVYVPEDPGANDEKAKEGRIGWEYGQFFTKGQRMGTGQCPVKRYNRELRDLIVAGKARPSFIVSHELALDDAPSGYEHFDKREDGWTKVLLHPAKAAA